MMIYLLHIHPPYKHARHYLGIARDLDARLQLHRDGHGARLTQVCVENGRMLQLVRTWEGNRDDERRLKNQKNSPRFCPLCNPKLKGVSHAPQTRIQAADREAVPHPPTTTQASPTPTPVPQLQGQ